MRGVLAAAGLALIPSMGFAATESPGADPRPNSYLQAGVMMGAAAPVAAPNLMAALEGGWRWGAGPAWLHAAATWCATGDDQGPGGNLQLRAGLEGRSCWWRDVACGVGGLDAGYQKGHWSDRGDPTRNESSHGPVLIPRVGLDVGGRHVRARAGLELDFGLATIREVNPATDNKEIRTGVVGAEANLGLAYQW